MMRRMLDELREIGYPRASLSVQKDNPALRLYERLGQSRLPKRKNGPPPGGSGPFGDRLGATRTRLDDARGVEAVAGGEQRDYRQDHHRIRRGLARHLAGGGQVGHHGGSGSEHRTAT